MQGTIDLRQTHSVTIDQSLCSCVPRHLLTTSIYHIRWPLFFWLFDVMV
jgi:hypothetical protein